MLKGLHHLHNLNRWLVVLFALLTLVKAARGLSGKRDFTSSDKRTALLLLIFTDVQLLLGLVLYFTTPDTSNSYFKYLTGGGMKELMHNAPMRYWTVEHTTGMLIAIILIHVGYAGVKNMRPAVAKFRRLFWSVFVALLIIIVTAPWPNRQPGIARPVFPGVAVPQ